jgi:hypothetical protein
VRRFLFPAACILGLTILSGCAANATDAPHPVGHHVPPEPSQPTVSPPAAPTRNLPITAAIRTELLDVAARFNGVPASDYQGFVSGSVHYAYDAGTNTYWAAGALLPRSGSTAAGVSVQDAGSYDLFRREGGGSWRAFDVGFAGSDACGVTVPPDVAGLWGWPAGSCRPPEPGH